MSPLPDRAFSRSQAEAEVLRQLKLRGSSEKFDAQRAMANACGINQATFNRAATELARRGVIKLDHSGDRVVMRLAG